jgi:glycosyltransferase involved in cell wall biosynthesis
VNNITFIFKKGREERISSSPNGPKEFFYTYPYFKKNTTSVDFIQTGSKKNYFLYHLFNLIRKMSDLPIFGENFMSIKHINKISNSKIIIATNQNLAFSILPIIIMKRLASKIQLFTFVMGLLDIVDKNFMNKYIVELFLKSSKKLIFISQNEYLEAKRRFPIYENKFVYIPFCVDTSYWQSNLKKEISNKILFIGNDRHRDFNFVQELAEAMPSFDFTFVTEKIQKTNLQNVSIINGNWNSEVISDSGIRELYNKSFLTLLPIKETYQPSGQSVSLQSISMGTPVMITNTKGFWDSEKFINNKNIFLIEKNNIELWKSKILDLYSDLELYQHISEDGKKTIVEYFNLDIMSREVLQLVSDSLD